MRRAVLLLLALSLAPDARAGMVTIHFGGHVTEIERGEFSDLPPLSVGDPFSGSYTYDDSAIRNFESRSFLFIPPYSISMRVHVGGTAFELDGTPLAGYLFGAIALSEPHPSVPGVGGYSVQVPSAHDPAHSYIGYLQLATPMTVPESGVLRDAPIPELSEDGGFFSFRAPADYEVSPERILPGIHPGGIPIFGFDPANPRERIQVATRFPRVIAFGSGFYGRLTSWQVPEPGALSFAILGFSLAVRRRSASRAD